VPERITQRPFEHFACAPDGQFVDVCDDSHAQSERWQVISIKRDKLMELAEDGVGVDCPTFFRNNNCRR
jgi:hypothetical protein